MLSISGDFPDPDENVNNPFQVAFAFDGLCLHSARLPVPLPLLQWLLDVIPPSCHANRENMATAAVSVATAPPADFGVAACPTLIVVDAVWRVMHAQASRRHPRKTRARRDIIVLRVQHPVRLM